MSTAPIPHHQNNNHKKRERETTATSKERRLKNAVGPRARHCTDAQFSCRGASTWASTSVRPNGRERARAVRNGNKTEITGETPIPHKRGKAKEVSAQTGVTTPSPLGYRCVGRSSERGRGRGGTPPLAMNAGLPLVLQLSLLHISRGPSRLLDKRGSVRDYSLVFAGMMYILYWRRCGWGGREGDARTL